MERSMKRILIVACLMSVSAYSEVSGVAEEIVRCESMQDSLERLTCYDEVARRIEPAAAPGVPVPQSSEAYLPVPPRSPIGTDEILTAESSGGGAMAVDPDAESAPVQSLQDHVSQQTTEQVPSPAAFGGEKLGPEKENRPARIAAVISDVKRLSRGNHQLTLENGQVWRELEYDVKVRYEPGDEVIIKRALFGSYTLTSTATGQSNKVQRIH
jgi:hypothetical protein